MDYDRAHLLIHFLDARNTLLNMILSTLLIYDLKKILAHGHTLADIQSVNYPDAIATAIQSWESAFYMFNRMWLSHPQPTDFRIHQDTSMQSNAMGGEMGQVDVSLSDNGSEQDVIWNTDSTDN